MSVAAVALRQAGRSRSAQRIAASRHLIFGGLQAYHGGAQHKRTLAERRN